jgi:transposase
MEDAYLGIDIGKSNFHAALLEGEKSHGKSFPNNPKGFEQLDTWLKNRKVVVVYACMESTGPYAEALATDIADRGHKVSIVNPARVKGFARGELLRTKTDAVDAALIARFCKAMQPDPWLPPAPEIRELQGLVRRLESLKQTRQQECNRAEMPGVVAPVAQSIAAHVAHLDQQIEALEQQIRSHIDRHPGLRQQHDLLITIPGIGEKTIATLLSELPDVAHFQSAKEVAAYAGLSVHHYESGTSIHRKSRLSKCGNPKLRNALFYPAMVAMRYNPIVLAFARQLAVAKKRKMVIVGAAMRKLLHIVFGVLKSGKPFNPHHRPATA